MISDKKLIELINGHENQYVDFKIRCDAFASPNIQPNAELAKDICAFANNGNISSFLIIGVSDDGTQFESVKNKNLQDDKVQDLCLKSIYPPPRIKVFQKRLRLKVDSSIEVNLIVIQIGPQKRQAFRLSKDFIDNKEKIYFRKNEVWIRRGTVVDTATPEEVARLVAGKELIESEVSKEIKAERDSFTRLSQSQKCCAIDEAFVKLVKKYNIALLPKRNRPQYHTYYGQVFSSNYYWIKVQSTMILIDYSRCRDKFIKSDSDNKKRQINQEYDLKENHFIKFFEKFSDITTIRRLYLVPVLASITRNQIQSYFKSWQWTGNSLYFFLPNTEIYNYQKNKEITPTSTELLLLDNITSVSDFLNRFDEEINYFFSYDMNI